MTDPVTMPVAPGANLYVHYAEACGKSSDIHEHLPLLRQLAARCAHVTEMGVRYADGSTIALLAGLADAAGKPTVACRAGHPVTRPVGGQHTNGRTYCDEHQKTGCMEHVVVSHPQRKLVSWDLDPMAILRCFQLWARIDGGLAQYRVTWEPRVGDTGVVSTDDTDMLFIDTLHTYSQLKKELFEHEVAVKRYIVLHDVETFGMTSEDGTKPGLLQAVQEFLDDRKNWFLAELRTNCNGLAVLERRS